MFIAQLPVRENSIAMLACSNTRGWSPNRWRYSDSVIVCIAGIHSVLLFYVVAPLCYKDTVCSYGILTNFCVLFLMLF